MTMEKSKKGNFVSIVAVTASTLLQKPGTEQVRQTLQAWTAVHTFATGDVRVRS